MPTCKQVKDERSENGLVPLDAEVRTEQRKRRTSIIERLKRWFGWGRMPRHLVYGRRGERAARRHLQAAGMKFLTANFKSARGEIDLVFRDGDCLVFVEVKTRSSEEWGRPAAAVDRERRGRLTRAGLDYLRLLKHPPVKVRFDVVEVLLAEGEVNEIRHLPNCFEMQQPHRYG